MTAIAGDLAPDLITAFGPQGAQFRLNVPEGHVARLYDFGVYDKPANASRYAINLQRTPVPRDGAVAWTTDSNALRDAGALASLIQSAGSPATTTQYPHSEHLWDLDYRVVVNPHVTGFAQGAQDMGFRLRWVLLKASKVEIAAILVWQNQGIKVE